VIENGAVLVKDGKIAEVYDGDIPDPRTLHAEAIEAAGKTILPGLIDVHVHLGASGGLMDDWRLRWAENFRARTGGLSLLVA
jgi:imidazolonepropionase-like amidohydrolase